MPKPSQKVLLLVGLPGSGKSHEARSLRAEGWYVVDDPDPLTGRDDIAAALAAGQNVVIADTHLCRPSNRRKAEAYFCQYPEVELLWTFFENDVDACRRNIAYRADGRRVEPTLRRYSQVYSIPVGITPKPVWTAGLK